MELVFARRQSPDWASLAADYRAGRTIDPKRYVPNHSIPGFPNRVDLIISTWNKIFSIDFFTIRAIIAGLSRRVMADVEGARHFMYDEVDEICALAAQTKFILFFHDDDDFFAGNILARLQTTDAWDYDTCVFPLIRVHTDLFTYVKKDQEAEFVWGRRERFTSRFMSNNYGISSRICTPQLLRGMKDHNEASGYANKARLRDKILPFAASATVKTPASASVLPVLAVSQALFIEDMKIFAERFRTPGLPDGFAWLEAPLAEIASLFAAAAAGRGYDALPANGVP